MDALEVHTAMSSQALNSQRIQEGLKDTLLGPAQLYEALPSASTLSKNSRLGQERLAKNRWMITSTKF